MKYLEIEKQCEHCQGTGYQKLHLNANALIDRMLNGFDTDNKWNKIKAIKSLRSYYSKPFDNTSPLGLYDAKVLVKKCYELYLDVQDQDKSLELLEQKLNDWFKDTGFNHMKLEQFPPVKEI